MARNLDNAGAKLCGLRKLPSNTGGMEIAPEMNGFDSFRHQPLHNLLVVFDQQRVKQRHVAGRETFEERRRNAAKAIEQEKIVTPALLRDFRDILTKHKALGD